MALAIATRLFLPLLPNDPGFYYHLAEASYRVKGEAQKYLDDAFGNPGAILVLEQHAQNSWISGTWKMTLFEDTRTGRLSVGFAGELSDLRHSPLEEMSSVADRWAKKRNIRMPILSFVGHSEGGYFATHVKKSWGPFRITFNAHEAEWRGLKNINLRLHGDNVSKEAGKDKYITLQFTDNRGHALKGFKCVQGKKWSEIDPLPWPFQVAVVLAVPTAVAAAVVLAVPSGGALVGYGLVSVACDGHELEEEDKTVTKISAAAGGVVGVIGTTAAIIDIIYKELNGTAVFGSENTVVAGVCVAFALPAAAAIGAGWIGHMMYQPDAQEQPQGQPQE